MSAKLLSGFLGERNWQRFLSLDYGARLYLCNLVGGLPNLKLRHLVYRKLGRLTIESATSIHRGLRLFCLGGISIGTHCVVNGECWLDGRSGITIGNNVSISIGSRILTLSHDVQDPDFQAAGLAVEIEDYVWIGAFATILPGVKLGRGSVVGAGAVVTKDVAPGAIVAGNPAAKIGQRREDLRYELHHAPPFC